MSRSKQKHQSIVELSYPMMDINVNVQDEGMDLEQFQNGQDNVVDVTESTSFQLYGMMETTRLISGNIGLLLVELNGPVEQGTREVLDKVVKAIKNWTVSGVTCVKLGKDTGILL